ncbi:hypothetical protein RHGRI_026527 [Rhododendron griersonianum]|uniref:Uncharacterized protein n=1 Tax=Rhododendron griersonianum TaxID=479676 RepID=A0AAV6IUQ0_9ERIC|nr:hypothetical protein RHGRI_026527 [Rhododendron griersonianum]
MVTKKVKKKRTRRTKSLEEEEEEEEEEEDDDDDGEGEGEVQKEKKVPLTPPLNKGPRTRLQKRKSDMQPSTKRGDDNDDRMVDETRKGEGPNERRGPLSDMTHGLKFFCGLVLDKGDICPICQYNAYPLIQFICCSLPLNAICFVQSMTIVLLLFCCCTVKLSQAPLLGMDYVHSSVVLAVEVLRSSGLYSLVVLAAAWLPWLVMLFAATAGQPAFISNPPSSWGSTAAVGLSRCGPASPGTVTASQGLSGQICSSPVTAVGLHQPWLPASHSWPSLDRPSHIRVSTARCIVVAASCWCATNGQFNASNGWFRMGKYQWSVSVAAAVPSAESRDICCCCSVCCSEWMYIRTTVAANDASWPIMLLLSSATLLLLFVNEP